MVKFSLHKLDLPPRNKSVNPRPILFTGNAKKRRKKRKILICLVGHTGRTLNSVLSHTPPAMSSLTHYKSFNFPFSIHWIFFRVFFLACNHNFHNEKSYLCFVFYFFGHMRKPKPFPGSCSACDGVHWWLAAGEKQLRKKKKLFQSKTFSALLWSSAVTLTLAQEPPLLTLPKRCGLKLRG